MEEASHSFPFSKLMHDIYLTLEVMMYVERAQALEFMFGVTKEARNLIEKQYLSIKNGFINEGLIAYDLNFTFMGFKELERLYF
jgi:hypothetical protein